MDARAGIRNWAGIRNSVILYGSLLAVLFFTFAGITMTTPFAAGGNATNGSVITRVNVTNTAPNIYEVSIDPSPITAAPGNTTTVNCTAKIYDANGWTDIVRANASFYHILKGDGSAQDKNYRYRNTSCGACSSIATNNASCSCSLVVQYYANNGSWRCNMTTADQNGIKDSDNSSNYIVTTTLGIDVPVQVDYGNLSVSETSSLQTVNITNIGNVPLNVSVLAYGGDSYINGMNLSMICRDASSINISSIYQRFSVYSDTTFANMKRMGNESVNINMTINQRTDENNPILGEDRNQTFWLLQIPLGVTRECNGTLEFIATDDS
ncbi:MAG: hypothetical protein ABH879_07855 [archaeon]